MNKLLTILALSPLMIAGCSETTAPDKEYVPGDSIGIIVENPTFTNGDYTVEGQGLRGAITIDVAIADLLINSITLVSHSETTPIWETIWARAEDTIVGMNAEELNNIEDNNFVITDATSSGEGIVEAIKKVINA